MGRKDLENDISSIHTCTPEDLWKRAFPRLRVYPGSIIDIKHGLKYFRVWVAWVGGRNEQRTHKKPPLGHDGSAHHWRGSQELGGGSQWDLIGILNAVHIELRIMVHMWKGFECSSSAVNGQRRIAAWGVWFWCVIGPDDAASQLCTTHQIFPYVQMPSESPPWQRRPPPYRPVSIRVNTYSNAGVGRSAALRRRHRPSGRPDISHIPPLVASAFLV